MGMGLSASQFKDPRLAELIRLIVAEINEKHDTTAIVEAIISLARSLYIEVVAEGVETTGQRMPQRGLSALARPLADTRSHPVRCPGSAPA
jgi:sensor c-di-GMP phosphodiesterase-like protein